LQTLSISAAEEFGSNPSSRLRQQNFEIGELVWGPRGNFPSWPGKVTWKEGQRAKVYFFGNKETSEVDQAVLKSLTEGLDDHHRERKRIRT
jgi:hypothetical protein